MNNNNIYEMDDMKYNLHPGGLVLTKQLLQESGLEKGRVLDIGCGCGESLRLLSERGFEVYGVDVSSIAIAKAEVVTPSGHFFCQDAENLQLPDLLFDAVLCECVLSTFDNRDKVLNNIYKLLKPGGLLLWSDLCLKYDSAVVDEIAVLPTLCGWQCCLEDFHFHPLSGTLAKTHWRGFIAQLLWEGVDLSGYCGCLPAGIAAGDITYCYGVARKMAVLD